MKSCVCETMRYRYTNFVCIDQKNWSKVRSIEAVHDHDAKKAFQNIMKFDNMLTTCFKLKFKRFR